MQKLVHTAYSWPHRAVRVLFWHLPEHPYPSDHPRTLRRRPRNLRG